MDTNQETTSRILSSRFTPAGQTVREMLSSRPDPVTHYEGMAVEAGALQIVASAQRPHCVVCQDDPFNYCETCGR